jgi:hypothetical protein
MITRHRRFVSAHRILDGVIEFRNWPADLPKLIVNREDRALTVSRRRLCRQSLVKRPEVGTENLLGRVPNNEVRVQDPETSDHLGRQAEQYRRLLPRLGGAGKLGVRDRLGPAKVKKQEARGERRFAVLFREADNCRPRTGGVVVNLPEVSLLPSAKLDWLSDVLPLRNNAVGSIHSMFRGGAA